MPVMTFGVETKIKAVIQSAIQRGNKIEPMINPAEFVHLEPAGHPGVTFIPVIVQVILQERAQAQEDINRKHDQFPFFGNPTSDLKGTFQGYYQHFEQGSIYWRPSGGAHEVHGAIRAKYLSIGGETSYLGFPTTDELSSQTPTGEVRYNNFEGDTIFWQADIGAFLDLSLYVRVERHQLGAWLHISGRGFTPASFARFTIEDLEGAAGPISIGGSATVSGDGTFPEYIWDGRTWPRGGTATLRAVDVATGRSATAIIPALS